MLHLEAFVSIGYTLVGITGAEAASKSGGGLGGKSIYIEVMKWPSYGVWGHDPPEFFCYFGCSEMNSEAIWSVFQCFMKNNMLTRFKIH